MRYIHKTTRFMDSVNKINEQMNRQEETNGLQFLFLFVTNIPRRALITSRRKIERTKR